MAAFQARRHEKAHTAHLVALAGFGLAVLPDRGMQPVGDRPAHQRVIGGMVLDLVEPVAVAVVGAQMRRFRIGQPRQVLRFGRHRETANGIEILAHLGGEILA
jgi:hypothetical protein